MNSKEVAPSFLAPFRDWVETTINGIILDRLPADKVAGRIKGRTKEDARTQTCS